MLIENKKKEVRNRTFTFSIYIYINKFELYQNLKIQKSLAKTQWYFCLTKKKRKEYLRNTEVLLTK